MNTSTSHTFRLKDAGAVDCWRVAIRNSDNHDEVIAYATGSTKEDAEANATLLVKALKQLKS